MAKRTNRVAWGLAAVLAVVVLGGGGVFLLARNPSLAEITASLRPGEAGKLYRMGLRLGRVDGSYGQDFSDLFAEDPLSVVFYLGTAAPEYIRNHPAVFPSKKQAQVQTIQEAAQLLARIETATPEQQRRYVKRFLAGYKVGNRLGRLGQSARRKMIE